MGNETFYWDGLTTFQNPHLLSSSLPIRALFVFAVLFLPSFNALSGYCCVTKFGGTSLFEFSKISSHRAQSDNGETAEPHVI